MATGPTKNPYGCDGLVIMLIVIIAGAIALLA
jgi:hypothetical protein